MASAQIFTKAEIDRWEKQARNITITRDNWGIPHINAKTDADAVFGLLYAQCEDDFKRVEMNYLEKLGRLAEIKGESAIYDDLLIRLVIDSTEAIADYNRSPLWLKKLLNAYADGINFYLYKHPSVQPVVLRRFKPWYPLLWTDGSIGAISTADITVDDLKNFYSDKKISSFSKPKTQEGILTGSNGFAFAPSITASGKSILYINPHVTFYFRPEVHVTSEEGLNVYGAVTWGQFFIYQGFNERCGWMHTSSYADVSDSYIEKVKKIKNRWYYEYEGRLKPVKQKLIRLKYKKDNRLISRNITAYFTHHGPIMAQRNGEWISMKAQNRSMTGLIQSWQRTKAQNFTDFKKTMDLLVNTSNNTVYADAQGNIAYWHGNFMPVRDTRFDWSKPVDGSIVATEWKGLHKVEETVHSINPTNGWLQNCNSTPYTVAGKNSPPKDKYPKYMAPDGENFRGLNAVRILNQPIKDYDLEKVIAAGYDTYLSSFELMIPPLVQAFEKNIKPSDSLYKQLSEPIQVLKNWDYRSGENSIATTLAIEWGQRLLPAIFKIKVVEDEEDDQVNRTKSFMTKASYRELLEPLREVIVELTEKMGTWKVPLGHINRFQRISSDMNQQYQDDKPSLPVGFVSSTWGMLPSYTGRYFPNTKKRYGVNGNSFVCAVEFGEKIKAKSLLAGGQSGDPTSPHFKDQAEMYTKGIFKDVLFYKEDIAKFAKRTYHPGK